MDKLAAVNKLALKLGIPEGNSREVARAIESSTAAMRKMYPQISEEQIKSYVLSFSKETEKFPSMITEFQTSKLFSEMSDDEIKILTNVLLSKEGAKFLSAYRKLSTIIYTSGLGMLKDNLPPAHHASMQRALNTI